MKLRTIKYYFAEAFANLFKNSLMTLASLVTVFSCTLMIIITFCVATNLDYILLQFERTLNVEVFFDNSLTDDDIAELYDDIIDLQYVTDIYYVSYEEALEKFQLYLEDAETTDSSNNTSSRDRSNAISDNLEPGVLPRSFIISIDEPKNIDFVYSQLESMESRGIYFPNIYNTLDIITSINTMIRFISIVIIIFLLINSIVVIINTVKLTVNNRKTDINIMKYVGATDWFIKWPFIIEGALIGLIGSAVSIVLSFFSYVRLIDLIYESSEYLVGIIEFRSGIVIFTFLIPVCLLLGLAVGIIGSVNAVKRYLNV